MMWARWVGELLCCFEEGGCHVQPSYKAIPRQHTAKGYICQWHVRTCVQALCRDAHRREVR